MLNHFFVGILLVASSNLVFAGAAERALAEGIFDIIIGDNDSAQKKLDESDSIMEQKRKGLDECVARTVEIYDKSSVRECQMDSSCLSGIRSCTKIYKP